MLNTWNRKHLDVGLLVLRIGLALAFVFVHGGPKVLGGPDVWSGLGMAMGVLGITFLPTFWGFMAAFSELLGGLAIGLGILTRPFLVLMSFTMIVAALTKVVGSDATLFYTLRRAMHPLELALVLIALILTGPGRYALSERVGALRGTWWA
jgi:putative oxidoreductase